MHAEAFAQPWDTIRLNNDDGDVSLDLPRKYQLFIGTRPFNKHRRFKETAMFCLEEIKVEICFILEYTLADTSIPSPVWLQSCCEHCVRLVFHVPIPTTVYVIIC